MLNEHHLTKESIDRSRNKSLLTLMGDEVHDVESVLFFIALSLDMVEPDSHSWKDFVYCQPALCEVASEILYQLIDSSILTEVKKNELYQFRKATNV